MNDDERLKRTFDALRAEDARRAPTFERVRGRRPRRPSPWAFAAPLASLAAAAAVVLWLGVARNDAQPTVAAVATQAPVSSLGGAGPSPLAIDVAPLDFLLDVPGVRGAPDFDTSLLGRPLR